MLHPDNQTNLTNFQWQFFESQHGNWLPAVPVSNIPKTRSSYASPFFFFLPSLALILDYESQAANIFSHQRD